MNLQIIQTSPALVLMLIFLSLFQEQRLTAQALSVEGFVQPYETVELAAAEQGIIHQVHVREGQRVPAGTVLVTLDHEVLSASLEAARIKAESKGALNSAQATWEQKSKRLQKIAALLDRGNASPEELQLAESEAAIARANLLSVDEQLRAMTAEVKRIKAQIEQRRIRSSIDGVVLRLPKLTGEFVSGSDPVVAELVRLDKLRVTFYLPTAVVPFLTKGQDLPVQIIGINRPVSTTVEFISPVTDSNSNTVRIVTVIENAGSDIRSGLRCQIADPEILEAIGTGHQIPLHANPSINQLRQR